jgi:hypothetical protein
MEEGWGGEERFPTTRTQDLPNKISSPVAFHFLAFIVVHGRPSCMLLLSSLFGVSQTGR